jgi:hypothetical protein
VGALESVIFTVKVLVPTSPAVAVPVMDPELESRVKPVGSVPEARLQVTGNVPPLSSYFRVWLYASPTIGFNRLVVVIVMAVFTVMLSCWVADVALTVLESVTFTVKFAVPADPVGVPEMVFPFRVRPPGSVPLLIEYVNVPAPPVAETVWLYAEPSVAAGNVLVIIESGGVIEILTVAVFVGSATEVAVTAADPAAPLDGEV